MTTGADGFSGSCTPTLCTLRDAIYAANLNPGDDIIQLPTGVTDIPISLSCGGTPEDGNLCGDYDIWDVGTAPSELRIVGLVGTPTGNTVRSSLTGSNAERLFHVLPPSESTTAPNVVFQSVELLNGEQLASTGGPFGGGCVANESSSELTFQGSRLIGCIRQGDSAGGSRGGGAIDTLGPLRIESSDLGQNLSYFAGGGAISADDTVFIVSSILAGNRVFFNCPGCLNAGGAIFMDTTASLTLGSTELVSNAAPDGGGAIYHAGGPLELVTVRLQNNNGGSGQGGALWSESTQPLLFNVDVGDNSTTGLGGAASLNVSSGTAPFIDRSSFWNNVAGGTGSGGALLLRGQSGTSVANSIRNSTFSGNQAMGGSGGAIRLLGPGTGHALTLDHVTLYENTADVGKELHANNIWSVTLASTILFTLDLDNTDCQGGGTFSTDGASSYNHASAGASGCGMTSDIKATAALGALGYYGNFTKARPIPASDPRENAGTSCPAVDQHGTARPPTLCDIGALE